MVSGPRSFKFQNMWLSHSSFLNTVSKSWNEVFSGGGMKGLVLKLQKLKKDLRKWNTNVFGNIFDDVKLCEDEVSKAEQEFQNDSLEVNRENWFHKKALLLSKYRLERMFWKQKPHIKWLKEGDCSSHYFHSLVKIRRKKQMIHTIKDSDGRDCSTASEIGEAAVSFFL
ncbi:unnamed protein product [Cuscuta epithymum]|uniref:Uncharacterized protein n=1 Tax=Cuscuta epithymum TaxID=186058 RepID=A0AAV0CQF3_9ASTE|nr:unnamed protein product [Cuscuta epithymum]CAH9134504.1 unnamed protein product [Cuscuta epithymum]